MLLKKIDEVPAVPVQMEGVKDVSMRLLFGPKDQAPTFAMRVFELEPEGHTPFHDHPFEHQVIALEGDIRVMSATGEEPLAPGDVLMVMPGEKHQFRNASSAGRARLICLVPVEYQQ